jgi:hypothetical protein
MTRVTFLEPHGELTPGLVGHVLGLASPGFGPPPGEIARWTPAELLIGDPA